MDDGISPKGYLPAYLQNILNASMELHRKEDKRIDKREYNRRRQCRKWLSERGTVMCCFLEDVKCERTEGCPVIWEECSRKGSTVVVDNHGNKKCAFVLPKNRDDGKLALIPLEVGDYVFRAQRTFLYGRPKRIRLCYQVVAIGGDLGEGKVLLRLENIGMENEWKEVIDESLSKAASAVYERLSGVATMPFAL